MSDLARRFIKPCPHCGGEMHIVRWYDEYRQRAAWRCQACQREEEIPEPEEPS